MVCSPSPMTWAGVTLDDGDDLVVHDQDAVVPAGNEALDDDRPAAAVPLCQRENLPHVRLVADIESSGPDLAGVEGFDHDWIADAPRRP